MNPQIVRAPYRGNLSRSWSPSPNKDMPTQCLYMKNCLMPLGGWIGDWEYMDMALGMSLLGVGGPIVTQIILWGARDIRQLHPLHH